jgi:thiamine pyrophosphokinase
MELKMKNKIALIANGTIQDINYHKQKIKESDILICADGGSNNAMKMNLIPDYIIGDFDSIEKKTLDFFKEMGKTKFIKNNDQSKTDFELALSLAETLEPKEIMIFGAIGNRFDHTIANILCLMQIKPDIKAQIIDEKNIIELVEKEIDINGEKEDIISIVPLTDVLGLNYKGLHWLVKDKKTNFGWFGISNKLSKNKANIKLKKGKILVIKIS